MLSSLSSATMELQLMASQDKALGQRAVNSSRAEASILVPQAQTEATNLQAVVKGDGSRSFAYDFSASKAEPGKRVLVQDGAMQVFTKAGK